MGPPLPPKPPSYAQTAASSSPSSSSRPLTVRNPSTLDPVESGSFFAPPPPAPSTSGPRKPILPPNRARPPTHPKTVNGLARKQEYVELSDDELTITTARSANPPPLRRGEATDKFRPHGTSEAASRMAAMKANKGKASSGDPPAWSRSSDSAMVRSGSNDAYSSSSAYPPRNLSSTRSTAVADYQSFSMQRSSSQASSRGKENEGWPSDPQESTDTGTFTDWNVDEPKPPSPSPGAPPRLGKGFITRGLVAYEKKDGAHFGIWKEPLRDFRISDTPSDAEDSAYKKMGEWVLKEPRTAPKAEEEPRSSEKNEDEVKMETDDVETGNSVSVSPSNSRHADEQGGAPREVRLYRTPTRAELDSIRPHQHAYYSLSARSWVFFIPLEPVDPLPLSNFGPLPISEVELWHESQSQVSFESLGIAPPIRPASDKDPFQNPSLLDVFQSTTGKRIAFCRTGVYPSVLSFELFSRLGANANNPVAGQTPLGALFGSMSLIWRVIDNVLFLGMSKALPTDGKTFARRFRWDEVGSQIFVDVLGFKFEPLTVSLTPPNLDGRTPEGSLNRARLLRCWLEVAIWIEITRKIHPDKLSHERPYDTRVQVFPAYPALIDLLGGDKLPKLPPHRKFSATPDGYDVVARECHGLGVTPDVPDEVIVDVYNQQVSLDTVNGPQCMPLHLASLRGLNLLTRLPPKPQDLDCLQKIAKCRGGDTLQLAVVTERSQLRYSTTDLDEAYKALGCTGDGDVSRTLDEEILITAFNNRLAELKSDLTSQRVLKDAFNLIAESRASPALRLILETSEAAPPMDLDTACRTLAVDATMDEAMLILLFDIRVSDSPFQETLMREALGVIAKERNLTKVAQYLKTGVNPASQEWESPPSVSLDNPIGLTNIANTCYLNSLLQYFFTVRELRETILQFVNTPTLDDGDREKGNRVGGRLVTKKEVERSKRFILLLQGLYNQLIHASSTAVTPETELAYLALVPSKEEIARESPKSKPITTIIIDDDDDDTIMGSLPATGATSPSILGKRGSDHLDGEPLEAPQPMAIDGQPSPTPLSDIDMSEPVLNGTSPPESGTELLRPTSRRRATKDSSPLFDDLQAKEAADGVVEIGAPATDTEMALETSKPPPLPSRPAAVPERPAFETQVSTYMAFGRQNDVTECMDNVMFQLECALTPSVNGDNGTAAGLLKRTFYGKMRQKLEFNDPNEPEPLRIKEEPFFSLLVDVAEEGRTIHDGLDTVFDDSIVDIEGKQARRTISLVDVPPILQVQLQRVQYDRQEKKIFKSNAYMSFSDTLSVDRYLEIDPTDLEAVNRKERTTECRRQLEKARARQQDLTLHKRVDVAHVGRDMLSHLSGCSELLGEDLMTPEILDLTAAEGADWEADNAAVQTQIESLRNDIEDIWAGQQSATFELVAVFIHRGTALSGHYFIYQRDSKKPERWLKYNDSLVTEIDAKDAIFRETTGDTNPYFLVYCRKDRLDAIESICRA